MSNSSAGGDQPRRLDNRMGNTAGFWRGQVRLDLATMDMEAAADPLSFVMTPGTALMLAEKLLAGARTALADSVQ